MTKRGATTRLARRAARRVESRAGESVGSRSTEASTATIISQASQASLKAEAKLAEALRFAQIASQKAGDAAKVAARRQERPASGWLDDAERYANDTVRNLNAGVESLSNAISFLRRARG